MSESSQLPPAPPAHRAPPTSPGAPVQERRHVWPVPIGVVLAVFGGGGVLAGAWMIVSWLFIKRFMPTFADMNAEAGVPIEKFAVWQYILGSVGLVLGALALIAGIGLARRLAWSPRVVRTWALLKLVYGVATAAITGMMQVDTMAAGVGNAPAGGPGPAFNDTFMLVMAIVTFVMYALWYSALPIFILIWMRRPSIRRETARWTAPSASVGD